MTTLRRTVTVLAGTVTGLCAATTLATAAFAQVPPAEPPYLQPPAQAPAGGSPWWVFALVAVGAAALTFAAMASTRLRHPGSRLALLLTGGGTELRDSGLSGSASDRPHSPTSPGPGVHGARGDLHSRRDGQFAQYDVDAGGPGADEQPDTDLVWLVLPSASSRSTASFR